MIPKRDGYVPTGKYEDPDLYFPLFTALQVNVWNVCCVQGQIVVIILGKSKLERESFIEKYWRIWALCSITKLIITYIRLADIRIDSRSQYNNSNKSVYTNSSNFIFFFSFVSVFLLNNKIIFLTIACLKLDTSKNNWRLEK